jgi:ABC-type phosphate transport system substrate-binding protein
MLPDVDVGSRAREATKRALAVSLGLLAWNAGAVARPETAGAGYRVIVDEASPVSGLKRADLARIFLKKQTRYKDGSELSPVDQSARSPVRAAFSRAVLAAEGLEKISAVENYWRQLIYSGRGTPPAVKNGDEDVRVYVAATPGGIGYVSDKAVLTGVKTVKIED